MANTESDYFVSQILDDEDLDYITEVLWQGYSPSPRLRYDLELYPRVGWKLHQKPQKSLASVDSETLPPPEVPKPVARAELYREIYLNQVKPRGHAFTCDRCKRRLWARNTEAEAEAAFRKTFGERPPEEPPHYALCEPCYNVMMADAEQG